MRLAVEFVEEINLGSDISEADWRKQLSSGLKCHVTPTRGYLGRSTLIWLMTLKTKKHIQLIEVFDDILNFAKGFF